MEIPSPLPDRDRKRTALILIAAVAVLILDALTPIGLAMWLLQIVLVWLATLWSGRLQIFWLTAVCAGGALLGFCLSSGKVSWIDITNLLMALALMAAIAYARIRQLAAEEARNKTAKQLEKSQDAVRFLSGLLPICSWCKKIRNEQGRWEQIEAYIRDRSHAEFTHGVCQDCAAGIHQRLATLSAAK